MNPHHGSSLESFLNEEGITEEATEVAINRVEEWKNIESLKDHLEELIEGWENTRSLEDYLEELQLLVKSGRVKRIECLYSRGDSDYTYSWPIVPGYLHPRDIDG